MSTRETELNCSLWTIVLSILFLMIPGAVLLSVGCSDMECPNYEIERLQVTRVFAEAFPRGYYVAGVRFQGCGFRYNANDRENRYSTEEEAVNTTLRKFPLGSFHNVAIGYDGDSHTNTVGQ